jgi:hypothetical protein
MTCGINNQLQSLTAVSSHELAEAITDPDTANGYHDFTQYGYPEIGDLAAGHFGMLNGYVVQAEWSNYYNDIVIPSDAQWWSPGSSYSNGSSSSGSMPGNLFQVADTLSHSWESYSTFVTQAYLKYLGRMPDAAGLQSWTSAMHNAGLSDEQLEASFIGSPEYIQKHGGTYEGWVRGLYHDLLGRAPSDLEVFNWVAALNHGLSANTVAYQFASSFEREQIVVAQEYQTCLHRHASATEAANWATYFELGHDNETVLAGLVGSAEFFNNPREGHASRADWVNSAFEILWQRGASAEEIATWLRAMP